MTIETIRRSKKDFRIGEIIQFVKPFTDGMYGEIKTGTLAVVRSEKEDGNGCGCEIPLENGSLVLLNVSSEYIERFINDE